MLLIWLQSNGIIKVEIDRFLTKSAKAWDYKLTSIEICSGARVYLHAKSCTFA